MRKKKCYEEIPTLPFPQSVDLRVVGWPFDAAVPGKIIIVAVIVAVAVRRIVLLVVADEVVQGETIVGGHEIYAGVRASPIVFI